MKIVVRWDGVEREWLLLAYRNLGGIEYFDIKSEI
jgi:hypothetical protein